MVNIMTVHEPQTCHRIRNLLTVENPLDNEKIINLESKAYIRLKQDFHVVLGYVVFLTIQN